MKNSALKDNKTFRFLTGVPLRLLLAGALAGTLVTLAGRCGNEAPPTGDAVRNRDSLPVMVTYGVSKLVSDSGIIRYKFISEEWRIYDKTQPPRWEFPKGIFIERYDDKFRVDMHITADSAWLYDQQTWKLHGHVELHDQAAGTHLTTEELFWDMNSGNLWSDVYTRLLEPEQSIEGNWFRATVVNNRLTRYHVRQSKGYMPMKDFGDGSSSAPATETADTLSAADSLPRREMPVGRPKAQH